MSRIILTGAIAAIVAAAGAVHAQPSVGEAVRIKVTDADLYTPSGAQKLAVRIRVAASTVCGRDLPVAYDQCRHVAMQHAIAGVDAPLLAQALGLGENRTLAQSH
jgi:UrcA family protein